MNSFCFEARRVLARFGLALLPALLAGLLPTRPVAAEDALPDEPAAEISPLSRRVGRPLRFELNTGQAPAEVKFMARGPGYAVFLKPQEAILAVQHLSESDGAKEPGEVSPARSSKALRLRHRPQYAQSPMAIRLFNARPDPTLEGLAPQSGAVNYFVGNEPQKWRHSVPSFAKVKYHGVYPGIDLIYYGDQRQLEYDFTVQPGADPGKILFEFAGARALTLDKDGGLLVRLAGTTLRWKKPVAWQEIEGQRVAVDSDYELRGPGMVSFRLGAYDSKYSLVIDPTLAYSTYLGGGALDIGEAIAVDNGGNVYVAGQTVSLNFPVTNAFRATPAGLSDAFVTKLNSNGTAVLYSTYLGGNAVDIAFGIAVDSNGNAYVTGSTESEDFPRANAFQSSLGGNAGFSDAFITKLGPRGTNILYSSYLGGPDAEAGYAIAVNSSGNAYLTGVTSSGSGFPKKTPFQSSSDGSDDAFVARINTGGSGSGSLIFASWLGGADADVGNAIAVDASGNIFVAGEVFSLDYVTANFPVNNGFQMAYGGGGSDGFFTKISSNGATRVFSSYLGGVDEDSIFGIAVDGGTNVYLVGETYSANFPVLNAYQPTNGGGQFYTSDAFVTRVSRTGNSLLYSTFLGGQLNDSGFGIAVGSDNVAYITGETKSGNFPLANLPKQSFNGGGFSDAFVASLNLGTMGLPSLLYSTYLGGTDGDLGIGIAVDTNGNFYVTGQTSSTNDFPRTSGVVQSTFRGGYSDSFVLKFAQTPLLSITRGSNGTTLVWSIAPPGFSLQRNATLASGTWSAVTNVPVISNALNRVTLTNRNGIEFYRLRKP